MKTIYVLIECPDFFSQCDGVFQAAPNSYRPNTELYHDLSERFHQSIELLASQGLPRALKVNNLKPLSAWQALIFVDYRDAEFSRLCAIKIEQALNDWANQLCQQLSRWLGLRALIGIGHTQTLATTAYLLARKAKRDLGAQARILLDKKTTQRALASLAVSELRGVGAKALKQLEQLSLDTALDLQRSVKHQLAKAVSPVIERLAIELSGIDANSCKQISQEQPATKELSSIEPSSLILEHNVTVDTNKEDSFKQLNIELTAALAKAHAALSHNGFECSELTLRLHHQALNDQADGYYDELRIPHKATRSLSILNKLSKQMLDSLYRKESLNWPTAYQALELSLHSLSKLSSSQVGLFDTDHESVGKDIHAIQVRCPLPTDSPPVKNSPYLPRTPSFTTQWQDILRVA